MRRQLVAGLAPNGASAADAGPDNLAALFDQVADGQQLPSAQLQQGWNGRSAPTNHGAVHETVGAQQGAAQRGEQANQQEQGAGQLPSMLLPGLLPLLPPPHMQPHSLLPAPAPQQQQQQQSTPPGLLAGRFKLEGQEQQPGVSGALSVDAHVAALAEVLASLGSRVPGVAASIAAQLGPGQPAPQGSRPAQEEGRQSEPSAGSQLDPSTAVSQQRVAPAAASDFLQRVLSGARRRSLDGVMPPLPALDGPFDGHASHSRSSSARTTMQVAPAESGTGSGGPSYGAAVAAADQVAHEINALREQQQEPADEEAAVEAGLEQAQQVAQAVMGTNAILHSASSHSLQPSGADGCPTQCTASAGSSQQPTQQAAQAMSGALPSSPGSPTAGGLSSTAAVVSLSPSRMDAMLAEMDAMLELGLSAAPAHTAAAPAAQAASAVAGPAGERLLRTKSAGQGTAQPDPTWATESEEPALPHAGLREASAMLPATASAAHLEPQGQLIGSSRFRSSVVVQAEGPPAGSVGSHSLPPSLPRRLMALHAQHDSVDSVGRLTADGGADHGSLMAGWAASSAEREAVAAQAADLAQHLVANLHQCMQQAVAAGAAAAASAEQAVSVAEAGVRELEAEGLYVEAAAAAMEADRWEGGGSHVVCTI